MRSSFFIFLLTLLRDQDWDLTDIQHHLVRTQRMQTAHNKKFIADIARIDMDIEDLMKQVLTRAKHGCALSHNSHTTEGKCHAHPGKSST